MTEQPTLNRLRVEQVTYTAELMTRIKEQAAVINEQSQTISDLMTQRDALAEACKAALPVLQNALAAACDDEETRRHVVENHPKLVQLRAAIAEAEGDPTP